MLTIGPEAKPEPLQCACGRACKEETCLCKRSLQRPPPTYLHDAIDPLHYPDLHRPPPTYLHDAIDPLHYPNDKVRA
jgi:hypothetical protein